MRKHHEQLIFEILTAMNDFRNSYSNERRYCECLPQHRFFQKQTHRLEIYVSQIYYLTIGFASFLVQIWVLKADFKLRFIPCFVSLCDRYFVPLASSTSLQQAKLQKFTFSEEKKFDPRAIVFQEENLRKLRKRLA